MKKTVTHLCIVLAAGMLVSSQALSQTPGTLDVSFDTDGIVTLPVNQMCAGFATVVQPDGKIIVVGMSYDTGANGQQDVDHVVARFLPNGSPDVTFGSGGVVITELNTSSGAFAVALEPGNGKIIIAGLAESGNTNNACLFRYNSDGTTDNSFGINGAVIGAVGTYSIATSIIVQPDGKILAGFEAGSQTYVLRFNNNGTIDNSFNGNGTSPSPNGWPYAVSMVLQPDGKIVVGGRNNEDFALGRLNADGTVDTGFGTNGIVQTTVGGTNERITAIALQPDGKIVATGTRGNYGAAVRNIILARYNANGTLDTGFGTTGVVIDGFTANEINSADAVIVQPDGKIIVGGESYLGATGTPSSSTCALARFSATGAADTGFGNNGKVITNVTNSVGRETFLSMQLQQDGKLVAAGTSNGEFVVARYITGSPALGLDEAYNVINGVTVFPNPATDHLTISYSLAQETEVSLHMCDVSGRYITPLTVPSSETAGEHEQLIQLPAALESGCYYVVMTAGNHQQTTRIVVSR